MEASILVDGLKINIQKRIAAGAKTIVFLHNSSGALSVWDAQFADDRFKEYTLIRFDLPGHGASGHSAHPEKDYTLAGMSALLLQIINRLQLDNYIVVAMSLSTNLVAEIAQRLNGCEGIFVAGASVAGGSITPADILMPFEFGATLFAESPADELLNPYIRGLYYKDDNYYLQKLIEDYRNTDKVYRTIMGTSVAEGAWTDEIANLAQSHRKIAWVYGAREQIINSAYLNKIIVPKWRDQVFSIADAGHLANLDQPGAFNELLLEFAGEIYNNEV